MSQDDGHLTDDKLTIKNHPGNPREYLGPIKTDPDELFIHTDEDLKIIDHFLEFMIGNGQLICRLDALCSQHITGRKTRGLMGINHSDAWGAEAFPYYRCRPAGQLTNNLLTGAEESPLELASVSNYQQKVVIENSILETSFDWQQENNRGHTTIKAFMSRVDPEVMVLRFCDHVESGSVKRCASVATQIPYPHRLTHDLVEAKSPAIPTDKVDYSSDQKNSQWLDYSFKSDYTSTRFNWYAKITNASHDLPNFQMQSSEKGGMAFTWECPAGRQTQVDLIYAIVSDRSTKEPHTQAAALSQWKSTFLLG